MASQDGQCVHWAIKASSVQLITHVGRVWLKHTFISPCTHFPSHQGNVIHNSTFQRGKYYILGQERDLYIELKIIIPHMHIPNRHSWHSIPCNTVIQCDAMVHNSQFDIILGFVFCRVHGHVFSQACFGFTLTLFKTLASCHPKGHSASVHLFVFECFEPASLFLQIFCSKMMCHIRKTDHYIPRS